MDENRGRIDCEHGTIGPCRQCHELYRGPTVEEAAEAAKEREEILREMKLASDRFYGMAAQAGCHAFIEFAGLMNEFIKVCSEAHAAGQDFTFASTHTGNVLPFKPYHLAYLAEKLNCIYGPSLLGDSTNRSAFVGTLFEGEFALVERSAKP